MFVGARNTSSERCHFTIPPPSSLEDKRTMNESCIGLREQRMLDKSRSAGHSGDEVAAAAAASSTGTLSSSVAEDHRLEQAAVELCDQVLQELDEDSKFFVSNPPRPVAMFHSEGKRKRRDGAGISWNAERLTRYLCNVERVQSYF
jgi:hypothetical protein